MRSTCRVVWSIPGPREAMRRVPVLFLETVAAVAQDLKSLKVVDIVGKQKQPVPSARTEGMEAGVRIIGVKSVTRSIACCTRTDAQRKSQSEMAQYIH